MYVFRFLFSGIEKKEDTGFSWKFCGRNDKSIFQLRQSKETRFGSNTNTAYSEIQLQIESAEDSKENVKKLDAHWVVWIFGLYMWKKIKQNENGCVTNN